jgi:hypothetical protein
MSGFVQLVEACEAAYKRIQEQHPEAPDAVVLIGSGGSRAKNLLGHFAPDRWAKGENDKEGNYVETTVHEILIVAEQLHRGPKDIFTTIIHEAVHGIAKARNVKDVSGRRHNKRFRNICDEVGLTPPETPDKYLGFSEATLPDSTAWIYENEINRIKEALKFCRLMPSDKEKVVNSWNAECDCGRKVRVGKKVFDPESSDPDDIQIECTICNSPFRVDDTDV